MGRHHKPNRERGNCAGNRVRIARIGAKGEIRRGEVISESLNSERAANAKAPGIVVYLKEADSANRRQLRRFIAQCGMTEHVCQWIQSRSGQRIPLALEISGSQAMIDGLTAWFATAENTIVIRWHAVLDAPSFVSGIGATSLDNCSENALRVIKRKYLRKAERVARYTREEREFSAACKRADTELKVSHGIVDGLHYAVPASEPAAPPPFVDCGRIIVKTETFRDIAENEIYLQSRFQSLRAQWLKAEIERLRTVERETLDLIESRRNADSRRYGMTGVASKRISGNAVKAIIEAERARRKAEREERK